ncbi:MULTISPECIES: helix-turn-helix domain-containing protein [unclassified Imperialibacter]|uniref:helix-turn-helix domain-containing protein n=1 Tax=unclassified Imperialibacter TaxID=2629706 RepID=UPI00125F40D4|nr:MULTISPECIES: AraC family transcriptional regulator [unclassified Imperialibacter]
MDYRKLKMIECDGFMIAATAETNMQGDSHPIYYPANVLVFVEQGRLDLKIENHTYTIRAGEFALIRKHTKGVFVKSWQESEACFREHIFLLYDSFIREAIREFEVPKDYLPYALPLIQLKQSPVLTGLMKSIEVYITGQAPVNRQLIRIKTMEALYALSHQRPDLIHVFNDFSTSQRADLVEFMNYNYPRNLTLRQFAELSGRSLSTFNRDFRMAINQTPRQWIREQRLELARQLMIQNKLSASDVFMEVGFEDLSHFSRSFKAYFGLNPSELNARASR